MRAVIMAGGKGTRLRSVVKDIPKPMIPIASKPVLEYQIESLKKSDVTDILIVIGYLGKVIREYFGDGQRWGVHLSYLVEEAPLGTAGALYHLKKRYKEDFLLLFGDLLLDVDWVRFMGFHCSKKALITLYGHPNSHPYDSDLLIIDQEDRVVGIEWKDTKRARYHYNLVNAGVYCVSPQLLDQVDAPEKIDLERTVIARSIPEGMVYAYRSTEYVKDMGTPDRLHAVVEDLTKGIIASRNLRNRQKCIFLDRDGTINYWRGFIDSPEQFELLPGVTEAIKRINSSEYLTIVATNQPVVARGRCSFEGLGQIHRKMESLLGKEGAYLDDIFFCPHHPHKGYEGEILELKMDCGCRKPKIGMLEWASKKYNIDLTQSWYIGDTTVDVQTGINAGMKTVLLKTGEGGADGRYNVKADYEAIDLLAAIDIVLNG